MGSRWQVGREEVGRQSIESEDFTSLISQETTDRSVSTAMLVQELDIVRSHSTSHELRQLTKTDLNELTFGSTSLIWDWLARSTRKEFDSGETSDIVLVGDGLVVRLVSVHVSDDAVGFSSECPSDVFVCWLHVLVMSASSSSLFKSWSGVLVERTLQ